MWALYYRFFEIATWTKGPEDLPKSTFLLGLVTIGYCLTAFLLHGLSGTGVYPQLVLADLALTGLLLAFLLLLRRVMARLVQTFTAVLGTATLINFVFVAPTVTLKQFDETTMPGFLASTAILVTVFWQWLILGHIIHRAINIDRVFGIVIAVIIWFTTFKVLRDLYISFSEGGV